MTSVRIIKHKINNFLKAVTARNTKRIENLTVYNQMRQTKQRILQIIYTKVNCKRIERTKTIILIKLKDNMWNSNVDRNKETFIALKRKGISLNKKRS